MDRYNTPLNHIFSRAHKLALEHKVELALLKALGESGLIPVEAHAEAAAAVASGAITLERTLAIEKETHHDIMAVVKAMTEKCPTHGGFIHYGATSQDVNDTVTALQLQACKDALLVATGEVRAQLTRLSERYRELPTIGRTHGQHAIPITMGFKFANYLYEMTVAESFLARVQVVAKFSGAVGTFASLGTAAVQESIMKQLGLTAAPISTQVVSRLHYADFVFALSAIAGALERLGREIRNLQRSEINELSEGFDAKQVGGGKRGPSAPPLHTHTSPPPPPPCPSRLAPPPCPKSATRTSRSACAVLRASCAPSWTPPWRPSPWSTSATSPTPPRSASRCPPRRASRTTSSPKWAACWGSWRWTRRRWRKTCTQAAAASARSAS
jgi:hypothetical protein